MNAEANLTFDGTNMTIANQGKIYFDSASTYIAANTDDPEDLEIHADQDILLKPDADVRIHVGSDEYATFIGSGNKLELKNDLDGEYQPLTLWNQSNAGDTTGKVSINYYLGDTSDNSVHSGKILVGKEQSFTTAATTQDSFMEFHTVKDGTVTEKMRITSNGQVGIGTTTPKHKLDVPGVGGLIYGATYLRDFDAGNTSDDVTTSLGIINSKHKISFVAPSNGKIKIKISFFAVHTDTQSATDRPLHIGIYANNNHGLTDYVVDMDNCKWDSTQFFNAADRDNYMQQVEAYFQGLNAGTTYQWEIHFKSTTNNSTHKIFYGHNFPPFIIEAISIPDSTITLLDSNTGTQGTWNRDA